MSTDIPAMHGRQIVQPNFGDPIREQYTTPEPAVRDLDRARLTVTQKVYHQSVGEKPLVIESAFGRWLTTQEQPYTRHSRVGETWQAIDGGWTRGLSQLVLENKEGAFRHTNPTEAEREAVKARVLEIGLEVGGTVYPFGKVHALETLRLDPENLSRMRLRCRSGEARYCLTLIPE